MKETSKSNRRRQKEVFWRQMFEGVGVDVGCGDDPHPAAQYTFDKSNGDACKLSEIFSPNQFDWIYSSQCLEHIEDPLEALLDWEKVLKPGGRIIVTVPDFMLYEQLNWPSKFNSDHKATFSLTLKLSPCEKHFYVPDLLAWLNARGLSSIRSVLVDTNYQMSEWGNDQTAYEHVDVEAWIEFVLVKLSR